LDVFSKKLNDLGKLWEDSTLAQAKCPTAPPPVPADPAVAVVEETKWELPEQAAEGA
jgi:hypothetical protein